MWRILLCLLALLVIAPSVQASDCPVLLDQKVTTLMDQPASLCQDQGKVVLVVNTASHCGFTPQYEGLEALYRRYKSRGLVVLGFPSNDFGEQEPAGNKEIAQFCQLNFGVSFPMFSKSTVVGPRAMPLYIRLAGSGGAAPKWNFHKYLIDRRGDKVFSYDSEVEPLDRKFVQQIERLLAAN
jgi:glutathione peroxidase